MKILFFALSFIASSFASELSQKEANQVRGQLIKSYNQVQRLSDVAVVKQLEVMFEKAIEKEDFLLAEKVEAYLESEVLRGQLKGDAIIENIQTLSHNGLFLVGWAICKTISVFNGGWCFEPSRPGTDTGSIGGVAFILLTVLTLGEVEAAPEM